MADQQHLDLLKQGVEAWNQWRREHPEIRPDLRDANLRQAHLSRAFLAGADLTEAFLAGADLTEAFLTGADLTGAGLVGVDLSRATLREADLRQAHLRDGHLSGADLSRANLSWSYLFDADLSRVNLTEAMLVATNLSRVNLSDADLRHADLSGGFLLDANLNGANLSGAKLEGTLLVRTNLMDATLTQCSIYGISVWDVQMEGSKQDSLIITPTDGDEPTITVDNLEVAQFIYLLLNHKKLRNVLNAVTERGVLLLGRFGGGGLEVLQSVAAKLREEKYLPIIFDFDRPHDRNYTETVKTLAGLSRFVIADLSGPSVPQELYATVPHFKIPFVPILEAGRRQFAMAVDLLEYPWVVRPPVIFASIDELLSLMPSRIIAPAEEKHQARQQLLDELFRPS